MKKRIFTLLLAIVMIFQAFPAASATKQKARLSDMSESECIVFVKSMGVDIPDDYEDEMMWGSFVKGTIAQVEENPDCVFVYSYSVTQAFAESIKAAVKEYYGADFWPDSATRNANTRDAAVLQDSDPVGEWSDDYQYYNCYGYAIGEYEWRCQPGDFCEEDFDISMSIAQIAQLVVEDLYALDYPHVQCSTTWTAPTWGAELICVRKGTTDFHFMRYSEGSWYHKPGQTQILRYKYQPSNDRVWTDEAKTQNAIIPATKTYDSEIYYITFGYIHIWEYVPYVDGSGVHKHIQKCELCEETYGSPALCIYKGGSLQCSVCGWHKNSVVAPLDAKAVQAS